MTDEKGKKTVTPEERQALLVEYQVCQSHNNSLGSQSWVSISIIITVNLLVLAQVVSQIVLKTVPIDGFTNLIVVILLGLLMIFILGVFWRWQKRITFLIRLNNQRMTNIEERLNFTIWKNWRPRGLDLYYSEQEHEKKQWKMLDSRLQEMITQLSQSYPKSKVCWWERCWKKLAFRKKKTKNVEFQMNYESPTTGGFPKFKCIFPALMIVWAILIFYEIGMIICRVTN